MTDEFNWKEFEILFTDKSGRFIDCRLCHKRVAYDEYEEHMRQHEQELQAAAGGLTWGKMVRAQKVSEAQCRVAGAHGLSADEKLAKLKALTDDTLYLLDEGEFQMLLGKVLDKGEDSWQKLMRDFGWDK